MCTTVSIGRASVDVVAIPLSLLQSSHPGLGRAPIMCSHFPHGNEHVIACLARLFFASCTALELIHEPRHSLLSPSLSKNSAAQVECVLPKGGAESMGGWVGGGRGKGGMRV
jgi:hypothetical protein